METGCGPPTCREMWAILKWSRGRGLREDLHEAHDGCWEMLFWAGGGGPAAQPPGIRSPGRPVEPWFFIFPLGHFRLCALPPSLPWDPLTHRTRPTAEAFSGPRLGALKRQMLHREPKEVALANALERPGRASWRRQQGSHMQTGISPESSVQAS